MSTPAPLDPHTTPATSGEPVADLGFEYALHKFWAKNAKTVYAVCAAVLVLILAKGGYGFFRDWQNKKIGAEYASASTSEKLKAFAAEYSGHPLGGAARLRLADEAYGAGNFAQAALDYQAATEGLRNTIFAGRARLGVALSKLQNGQAADAEALLKQLTADTLQLKSVQAEAAYQLASGAITAGRTEEAIKYLDQVSSIEPTGPWAQRAMMLRSTLSAPVASAVPAPVVKLPAKP